MILQKLLSILGIVVVLLVVWLMSEDKKKFPFRIVIWGMILQFTLGFFVLYVPFGIQFFQWVGDQITVFLGYGSKSAEFLFGNMTLPAWSQTFGFQFAITVTVTIVFFSAFVNVLYHFGIMQKIVYGMAWIMQKTMGTSGIESLSGSANVFMGQTEAPLLIRHYLPSASRSELNAIMVCGFATIAGGVMAAYIQMGISATMLITASLISVPGGLYLSKIAVPPDEKVKSLKDLKEVDIPKTESALVAVTNGASDGLMLALNIMAMLIAFIAIIAVFDAGLKLVHDLCLNIGINWIPASLKELLGFVFQPFAYLAGIPAEEAKTFGSLIGSKVSINEFIAYLDLSTLIRNGQISERTAKIATFAICGFANFSSIAIQIGGIGSMAPGRKAEIAQLGVKAMIVGALTNLLTSIIASIII